MARELDPDQIERADRPSASSDLRRLDRVMEIVGVALLPIGLTAILLGYLGVASHGLVFLQIPYVISGGLLGVGLLFAGGTIYLASWVSRASAAQREQNDELIAAVRALQGSLGRASLGSPGDPSNGHTGSFVATPSGSMFHRPDCAVVLNREDVREIDDPDDLRPCGMCDPLGSDVAPIRAN